MFMLKCYKKCEHNFYIFYLKGENVGHKFSCVLVYMS